MKKVFVFIALTALCIAGCDCPDCGNTGLWVNPTEVFIYEDAIGSGLGVPERVTLKSSYNWTATNQNPEYMDFANTSGEGGIFAFPVNLKPAFFTAFAADPTQFPLGANGYYVGQIRFAYGNGDVATVAVYYRVAIEISFHAHGGSGSAPGSIITWIGAKVLMPGAGGMTFSGKSLVGWNSQADGSGKFYRIGSQGSFTESVLLYAFWSGNGSPGNPYIVYDKETLDNVRDDLDGEYLVIADIDTETYDEETGLPIPGKDWLPIGRYPSAQRFIGKFDGNGHTITYGIGSTIPAKYFDLGVFGCIGNGAVIKNLKTRGAIVITNLERGISYDGIIISASHGAAIGGVVGRLAGGNQTTPVVSQCISEVNIEIACPEGQSGNPYSAMCGGIVGVMSTGYVNNCYATGNVSVKTILNDAPNIPNCYAGGIVGYHAAYNSVLEYCYATGNIKADAGEGRGYAGGIAGYIYSFAKGCVAFNASVEVIGQTQANIGRVHGYRAGYDVMLNNYGRTTMMLTKNGAAFDAGTNLPASHQNNLQGVDLNSQWQDPAWWTNATYGSGAGWSDSIWDFSKVAAGEHPKLKIFL